MSEPTEEDLLLALEAAISAIDADRAPTVIAQLRTTRPPDFDVIAGALGVSVERLEEEFARQVDHETGWTVIERDGDGVTLKELRGPRGF